MDWGEGAMFRKRAGRGLPGVVIVALCFAAMAALPPAAGAVLSGINGRIVFSSGRGQADDSTSKLYLRPTIGSAGAGSASLITTATGAGQHRHPTWSPDRTKIAYAEGPTTGSNFDIFILDLTNPAATPQNITNSNNVTDDRPAWSPDGTRIAFESEDTDGSNQLNIKIYNVATGVTTNLTSTATNTYEHKPAWTPDSQTIFFGDGNPSTTTLNDMDILFQPVAGGGATQVTVEGGVSEFQPSISPDGTRMCFTRGDLGDGNARVVVSLTNGGGQMVLPGNVAGPAGYNCTWSPDGTKIAYVQGVFSTGDLVMENSDLSGGLLPLESTVARFDGNPDWAPDGRPQCADKTVITAVNTPVSIPLTCPDTGPAYEQTSVRATVLNGSGPTQGSVSPASGDPPVTLPASITYTPNPGFIGNDSFVVRSLDEVAFGDRDGTQTVRVALPCAGRTPTILGTAGADQLVGTPAADVIDGLGGKDTVAGLQGSDFLCGGPGKDTLNGGPGKDTLLGQAGKDKLKGGKGKDICKGGKGKDTATACERVKSI
jgi:Tol biopolymer transport system component